MPEAADQKERLLQNLKDAGCNEETICQCMELTSAKDFAQAIRKLKQHKKQLLDSIHVSQKQIDCLDYLIYSIEKHSEKGDF